MLVLVFALGRPGCGKSTATRYMIERMRDQNWNTIRIKDYDLLYEMFRSGDQRFRPTTAYDGFDVVDFSVLDEVLPNIQKQAIKNMNSPENTFITIEFARNDYDKALRLFDKKFLQQAYFLFVDAGLEICIQRIYERIKNPARPDNHFVSEKILREYYGKDTLLGIKDQLQNELHVDPSRVNILRNDNSQEEFYNKVEEFLQAITSPSPSSAKLEPILSFSAGLG